MVGEDDQGTGPTSLDPGSRTTGACACQRPALSGCSNPPPGGSGDKMLNGGTGCARPRSLWRPPAAGSWRQARGGRGPRHICCVVSWARTGQWWRSGGHRQGQVGNWGEGGVAEPDQGVTDPAGELAGHRQGSPVAVHPGLDLGVEVMVGGGRAGGALGGLEQRPAQHLRSLAG
jgi:hypothetical protein